MFPNEILNEIKRLQEENEYVIIAVDGRCCAGKSTLAEILLKETDCNVIHMDSFFLPPHKRTEERLKTPGGNVDYERFYSEVLVPLKRRESFLYRPYDCQKAELGNGICVDLKPVTIVEGSYSCHPQLFDLYDLHIFLDISEAEQIKRLKKRNPHNFDDFISKWIPMEELYFKSLDIKEKCELVFWGNYVV